jgi:hypothetical protein
MHFNSQIKYILLILLVFSEGCATFQIRQQVAGFERPPEYVQFFEVLDDAVKNAGVRNAADFAVTGFPYLRTSRFLQNIKTDLDNEPKRQQWVRAMRQLDLAARRKEIQNLPAEDLKDLTRRLALPADRNLLLDQVMKYSDGLFAHDQHKPGYYQILSKAATVPDEYSTAMRVVGIYPLTSIPVASVTRNVQDRFRKLYHAPADQLAVQGKRFAYGPPPGPGYSELIARLILERSSLNALGIPQPSIADQQILLAMFAPVFYQDDAADYDKPGEVAWLDDKVRVNPAKPTVYYYFSNSQLNGEPILQLNYVIWYSARNGPLSPWIERGPLDGLTVRVSLNRRGYPFMVDIMNNCGCYHFFLPQHDSPLEILSMPGQINAFVPRRLPSSYPRRRLRLWIMSGWHQIDHLDAESIPIPDITYRFVDYEQLESLPRNDRSFESIFNAKGIGKDSPRIESLIFFPMGIADIGSMRQRGHHAVLFIGRAHFDDPDLFDKNFDF